MSQVQTSEAALAVGFRVGRYEFKRAETNHEFAQLHELNYRTFVQEVGQYEDRGAGSLVDKFHGKNTYFMAVLGDRAVGMVAVHDEAPFSIEGKLADPAILESFGSRPLEVRLLAVEPDRRHRIVFAGLTYLVYNHARRFGYSHLLISGIQERVDMYERLGFEAIGPGVKNGEAHFIPMVASVSSFPASIERDAVRFARRTEASISLQKESKNGKLATRERRPLLLLPGPVHLTEPVRVALERAPLYHRGDDFRAMFARLRKTLSELVGGKEVALFNGSGTLANEVVAATLSADRTLSRGIILVTGEFGERLSRQAKRHGLEFDVIEKPWGSRWPIAQLEKALDEGKADWVWAAHLETSTGRLNHLDELLKVTQPRGVKLCLDCVSSLGSAPLDLTGVHLASGTSGKSLASKAGIAIVFGVRSELGGVDPDRVPVYLDLVSTFETEGPRFTFGSQDLVALDEAVRAYSTPTLREARFQRNQKLAAYIRKRLVDLGISPLVDDEQAAPIITTVIPPRDLTVTEFVELCRSWGILVGGESGYLQKRGWVQIANMGDLSREDCESFFVRLEKWLAS